MGIILSAGESRFLTGPLLLGVSDLVPKAGLGFQRAADNFCTQHQSGALANKLSPVVLEESAQQFKKHTASAKKRRKGRERKG